jgi:hypothetical protein
MNSIIDAQEEFFAQHFIPKMYAPGLPITEGQARVDARKELKFQWKNVNQRMINDKKAELIDQLLS